MQTRTVRQGVVTYRHPGDGSVRTAVRGATIVLSDDDAKLLDARGATTAGDLEVPGPERAVRIADHDTQVPGAPVPGPIIGRPIGTADPDADARARALLAATLSSRGLPIVDDVEDIDAPDTDTGLDTVNPNPTNAPVVVPPAAQPAVSSQVAPAADPFAGVESGQQTATQPAAAPTAAPLDKPIRAASKATWVAYVASLPADRRDGLDEAGIDAMSKIDIVNTWGK